MRNELYEKMAQLQWLLRRQHLRGMAERGPLADPTRGQGRILAVLKLRDGISTKDLAYLLDVQVSSLNELLSKMEKNGYVTREPSGQDKRIMLVKLTDKGNNERQPESSEHSDIFSCLSGEEQKTLSDFLDRIIDALYTEAGDEGEEMAEKMEALRARLGDIGDFLEGRGRFPGGWGMAHGLHMRYGHGRFGHDGFPGRRDFRDGGCNRGYSRDKNDDQD